MTTDPQADVPRSAFVEYLTAHLDRSRDQEPELEAESGDSAGSETGPHAEPDTQPDTGPDAEPDTGPHAESNLGSDTESNLGPDTLADVSPNLEAADRVRGLIAALSAPATWTEPPDLRSQILTRVRALAEQAPAPAVELIINPEPESGTAPQPELSTRPEPAPEPALVPEPGLKPDPGTAPVIPLRPRWQRLTVALPLAAAAAVVVTLSVLGVQAALRPDPDQVFTALGSGDLRAKVTVTSKPSGFQITLEAKDLPAAPTGSYYAAWLRRGPGPGDVVPIGTFHGRRVGGPIVLWSGVDPATFRTFSVTLQRDGEPPLPNAPSAHRVLVGSVDG